MSSVIGFILHCYPLYFLETEQNRYFILSDLTVGLRASVAQWDERLTGDKEAAGLIPAVSCNILSWRLIKFSMVFPSADSRRAVVSFWWKNVHEYWLMLGD